MLEVKMKVKSVCAKLERKGYAVRQEDEIEMIASKESCDPIQILFNKESEDVECLFTRNEFPKTVDRAICLSEGRRIRWRVSR